MESGSDAAFLSETPPLSPRTNQEEYNLLGEPLDQYMRRCFVPAVAKYFLIRNALRLKFFALFDFLSMLLMVWQSILDFNLCRNVCIATQSGIVTVLNDCNIVINALLIAAQILLWSGQLYTVCTSCSISEIKPTVKSCNLCHRRFVVFRGSMQIVLAVVLPQLYVLGMYEGLDYPGTECITFVFQIIGIAAFLSMVSILEFNYKSNLEVVDKTLTRFRRTRMYDIDAVIDVTSNLPKYMISACGFACPLRDH